MRGKGIASGAEGAGHLKNIGIAQSLLHALAGGVIVVFSFDNRNGYTCFPLQNVVGKFFLLGVACGHIAANDVRARGQGDFATNLGELIPARVFDGRGNKEITDVYFAELLFFAAIHLEYYFDASPARADYLL